MVYAFTNIGLFKIDCSTPDQTFQIYVELVLCNINTASDMFSRDFNINIKIKE